MALGSYPDVGLKAARKARDTAKLQKSDVRDPVQARKADKLRATRPGGDTFKAVALEWYGKQAPNGATATRSVFLRQLERELFPSIGSRAMTEIHPMEMLAALHKVEDRGALETADRVQQS